ncbi:MGDG synthase family glycosyltransferase [Paenibacillus sp. Z6-24]
MQHGSPCVLIVYASYGDGHLQAARSLRDSLHERGIQRVILLDLMAESHPWINEITRFVYMQSFKTIPHLYGWVYYRTREMKAGTLLSNWLHSFGIRRLREVMECEQPHLVIHTFPQLALPHLRTRWGLTIPLVNIVTDYDLHGRWLHPQIDHYYVPSAEMKEEAVRRGIAAEKISVAGIPLHHSFEQPEPDEMQRRLQRRTLRQEAGLDPELTTVLLLAGAYGVLKNVQEICEIVNRRTDTQLIVICGKNRELCEDLDKQYAHHPNIRIEGFTDRMNQWMTMSDCVITKPGGLTMAECISCKLPAFLMNPVPGQERENALYLEARQAAQICSTPQELNTALRHALDQPDILAAMRRQMGMLRTPPASAQIAEELIGRYLTHVTDEAAAIRPRLAFQDSRYV